MPRALRSGASSREAAPRLRPQDRQALRNAESNSECIDCHRQVHQADRRVRDIALPKTDFCSWCSRPTSDRARELEERVNTTGATDALASCAIRSKLTQ